MKAEQLRDMTKDEILQRQAEIEEELFNLRLQKSSKQLDNPLKLRTLGRDLARIKTILREDELGLRKLASTHREKVDAKEEEKGKT